MEKGEINRLLMKPTAQRRLGKYVLLGRLGQGGMGKIYLAYLPGPGGVEKLLVIKRLHSHLTNDPVLVGNFLDEARLSMMLSHPNIVHTYDVGEVGGRYFMVMEYIDGQNLGVLLRTAKRSGNYPSSQLWAGLFTYLLEALHAAHVATDARQRPLNIIHRDISPQNIIVTYDGAPKLVDFGIAKAAMRINETDAGVLKGKYAYMSPEQCQGENLDPRSDIFSAGVVLWECLAGRRLYKSDSIIKSVERILKERPISPDRINSECDPLLAKVVVKALQKNPSARFESAETFRDALDEALQEGGHHYRNADARRAMNTFFHDVMKRQQALLEQCLDDAERLSSEGFPDMAGEPTSERSRGRRRERDKERSKIGGRKSKTHSKTHSKTQSESDLGVPDLRKLRSHHDATTPSSVFPLPIITEEEVPLNSPKIRERGYTLPPTLASAEVELIEDSPAKPPARESTRSNATTPATGHPMGSHSPRPMPPRRHWAALTLLIVFVGVGGAAVGIWALQRETNGEQIARVTNGMVQVKASQPSAAAPGHTGSQQKTIAADDGHSSQNSRDSQVQKMPTGTATTKSGRTAAGPAKARNRSRQERQRALRSNSNRKRASATPNQGQDRAQRRGRVTRSDNESMPRPAPHVVVKRQPAKTATGQLTLQTQPWTTVYLGSKKLGNTPLINVSIPAGRQTLRLVNTAEDVDQSYEVRIEEGKKTRKRLGLK